MNNRTKLSHNVAAVVVALGALILAAAFLRSGSGEPARHNPRPAQDSASNASLPEASVELAPSQLNAVKIEPVGTYQFPVQKGAVGSIDYDEDLSLQVFSPYQGKILAPLANLGDEVQKGQPLYTIDSPDLIQAESSLIGLIKDLKKSSPNLVVLVLSMHDESLYAERALRAGAKGYIMKRETTRKVIDALRSVLEGKFYVSETIAQTITAQFVEGKTQVLGSPVEQLSDRELAVFDLLGEGRGTRQIAEVLRVSVKTVQSYCARIKEKLNLASGADLVREAIRHKQANERE